MPHLKELQKIDPLKRTVEKQTDRPEYSPMDPPEAYSPPGIEPLPYQQMPPILQKFIDEHQSCLKELDDLEEVLGRLQQRGLKADKKVDRGLKRFFRFIDECIVPHNLREEKILFPLLQQRLLEKGEHSRGSTPETAVDMLEDDHIKFMQLAAVTFNFLGLAARLPDAASRAIVLNAALAQGKAMVELLRLHFFREENVVFPLAVKHLSGEEFAGIDKRLATLYHD